MAYNSNHSCDCCNNMHSYVKRSCCCSDSLDAELALFDYHDSDFFYDSLFEACKKSQRDIDPREVTARMDSPIVKAVLRMDIPKERVKKAIRNRLAENGEDFNSAEALLEAVFSHSSSPDHLNESPIAEVKSGKDLETENGSLHSGGSENQDSMRLMEENRLLKEQRQCKICMDEEVCVVFLPCGHLVCCSTCAPALTSCPICRAKIRGTVRTYIS